MTAQPASGPATQFATGRAASMCPGATAFVTAAVAHFEAAVGTETLAGQRASYDAFAARFRRARPAGLVVDDREILTPEGMISARVYHPGPVGDPKPAVLFIHGGGWVVGSPDTHDGIAAEIADRVGAVVVSPDYRLAPEHPYPAALDDCAAVLAWMVNQADALGIDAARMAIAGDSAGGNLATALALKVRGQLAAPIVGQALIYPVLGTDFNLPSYVENADAPMLTTADMQLYWSRYLGGPFQTTDPLAAPLAATDLSGLPPTLILTAGFDCVRDDGDRYARKLVESGVPVTYNCAADLPHGYLRAGDLSPSASKEMGHLCHWLRVTLRG